MYTPGLRKITVIVSLLVMGAMSECRSRGLDSQVIRVLLMAAVARNTSVSSSHSSPGWDGGTKQLLKDDTRII